MPPLLTPLDLEMFVRISLAFVLGGIIGWERERRNRPAGLRTHILVAAGSACFTLASIYGFGTPSAGVDTSRVAAQIVSGVGFLGAGTIFRTPDTVRGLTTAASIWMVAAIGMLAGAGLFALAVFSTALVVITLTLLRGAEKRALRRIGEPSIVPDLPNAEEQESDEET